MPGSFSLAGLRILELEEDEEEAEEADTTLGGRSPPLVNAATGAVDKACPPPLPRFRLDTGKGGVEVGLLAELCLLSGRTAKTTKCELLTAEMSHLDTLAVSSGVNIIQARYQSDSSTLWMILPYFLK